jgi:GNAT superfamily N-acetyltransferase
MAQHGVRLEALGPQHDRSRFECGNAVLDHYFRQQAGQDIRRRLAAVFVMLDAATDDIVGYYSLSATSVEPQSLPEDVTRRLPRYPLLPAILLGRLAVALDYQGRGLGGLLLIDALRRSLGQSTQLGAVAELVDAIDDAAVQFYQHHDFQPLLDQPRRLFIAMERVARIRW